MNDKLSQWKRVPKGKRLEYLWMYYKWHAAFALLGTVLIGYTLYGCLKPRADLQVMWMSDSYTPQCEYALRNALEAMDWDTNGDGQTNILLTYIAFDTDYEKLSYSRKSEITVLIAGQEYSFFLVNDYAKEWMRKNDLLATWREIGVTEGRADAIVSIPLAEMEIFTGESTEPLQETYLCVAQAVDDAEKQREYQRQAEALRRLLISQSQLPPVSFGG